MKTAPALERHKLSLEDFRIFQKFLAEQSGIELADSKCYLIQSRLGNLLPEIGVATLGELIRRLNQGTLPHQIRDRLINAMTTNETFWFRDGQQFELLQNRILPELSRRNTRPLRIWSAACSTGQEPYSISLCVQEAMRAGRLPRTNVEIVGTDLVDEVLKTARSGVYSDMTVTRGLPADLKSRYFQPHPNGWRLKPEVTRPVRFQQLNLLKPFVTLGKFDCIFCRNVLIYFSPQNKLDILKRMAEALNPDGYLFLSGTESLPYGIKHLTPALTAGVRHYIRTQS